ncbi:unnamed protein product [Phytomonas sp. EM1]|nr:unnamed protein product [Phytomonas sp. EM1]|eukprot:CCW62870.1 unnamed protein product [Phytomonas sp. isolate EM1]
MRSSANREAFLREMGITNDDILHPDDLTASKDKIQKPKTHLSCPGDASYATNYKGAGTCGTGSSTYSKNPPVRADAAAGTAFAAMTMNTTHIKNEVEELKTAGNHAFENGKFAEAIRLYTKAIKCHGEAAVNGSLLSLSASLGGGGGGGRSPALSNGGSNMLLATLYSNRSAAYMQAARDPSVSESPEAAYQTALCDAEQAVALCPDWFKPYSRQGDACFKLRQYHQAAEAYQMALCMEPGNVNLANSLRESQERARSGVLERVRGNRGGAGKPSGFGGYARGDGENEREKEREREREREKERAEAMVDPPPRANPARRPPPPLPSSTAPRSTTTTSATTTAMTTTGSGAIVTPEEYRSKQLEAYRRRRVGRVSSGDDTLSESARTTPPMTAASSKQGSMILNGEVPARTTGSGGIPYAFSSEAAAAYQQKLLEEFRRKNGKK